jgi:ubiquinone/menaquinone biosynthesis C-methylase UbiE
MRSTPLLPLEEQGRKRIEQFFDDQVSSYKGHFLEKPAGTNHLFRTRLRLACELAASCSGNLLECAAGTGEITGAILNSGNFHSAIVNDISSNMLGQAQKLLEAHRSRCHMKFIQSDIFDFNGDNSARKFDLIVCLGLIPHVGHAEELLKHLKTHLSESGKILCQITLGDHPCTRLVRRLSQHRYFRKHGYRIFYYSKTEFEQLSSNAGLCIVDSRRHALGLTFGDRIWAWGNYQAENVFQSWAIHYGADAIYLLASRQN